MPPLYDPKALTESLELDYVNRPRALNRWLRRCTWAAGAAALIFVVWAVWPTNHMALQAGPLSTSHAMFSNDCGKCHTESFATALRLVSGGGEYILSTPDHACTQCHKGPDHNRCVEAKDCASCHKEHRGDALLARPNDRHCTNCHADLKAQFGSECASFRNVASFGGHPEFALWSGKQAVDPGNVEFNHHKHLGLRVEDKLAGIEVEVLKLQQLQCGYCHQLDAAGKYMQPIQYDKHCQDCHPLLLPVDTSKVMPEALKLALQVFLKKPVSHPRDKQSAWHVRAEVRERYLKFAQTNPGILKLTSVPQEDWMILGGLPSRGEPATPSQIDWVNTQWKMAEMLFFDKDGCVRCHQEIGKKAARPDGLPDFGQPVIPSRWLKHSVFDHKAHRMVECASCHEKAPTSATRSDVLIPKLSSCQACHQAGPASARADCMECHTFHQR